MSIVYGTALLTYSPLGLLPTKLSESKEVWSFVRKLSLRERRFSAKTSSGMTMAQRTAHSLVADKNGSYRANLIRGAALSAVMWWWLVLCACCQSCTACLNPSQSHPYPYPYLHQHPCAAAALASVRAHQPLAGSFSTAEPLDIWHWDSWRPFIGTYNKLRPDTKKTVACSSQPILSIYCTLYFLSIFACCECIETKSTQQHLFAAQSNFVVKAYQ